MFDNFVRHAPDDIAFHQHADVMVHMMQPPQIDGTFKGQHKTNFTMWESSALPERFIHWLRFYDQVLVPCDHNVELFSRHHGNVKKVPLGVDHKVWKAANREPNPRFRFHAGGSQWLRKGLDVVLEAFKRADLDAELHIKLNPEEHNLPQLTLPDNVFLHRNWFTLEDTVKFFQNADCWVAVTRGEGFGLMPLQAAAVGVPTIMNAASGQAEFSYLGSVVVPHRPAKSHYGGMWDESDPGEVAEAMRDIYQNHATYKTAARNQVKDTQAWSWKKAARKLADALPVGGLLKDPVWVDSTLQMRMRVNRKVSGSINNNDFLFHPGQDYVVKENVYQVLLGGGYIEAAEVEPQ